MLPPGCTCYLINLDRSPQRLAEMQVRLDVLGIDYIRIAATDGAHLTDEEFLHHTVENRYYKPIRRGEVGCYLSHLKVLQAFMDSDACYALVLEDDCLFDPDFVPTLQAALALRDGSCDPLLQWDVLKLNRQRRRLVELAPLTASHRLVEYGLSVPITTAAALWTRAAAERFLRAYRGTTRPIDCDLQHPWEFGLNILALQPPPVTQGDVASTIGNRKHPAYGPLAKLGYELHRLWPKLRHFGQRYGWTFIAGWLWRRQLHYRRRG